MKRWIALTAAVAVLTFTGCSGKGSEKKSESPGNFEFKGPGDVTIKQGEEKTVHVSVKRAKYTGPVSFSFEGLPEGVTSEGTKPHQIEQNADKADVTLKATKDAKTISDHEVKVEWKAGSDKGDTKFKITVKPK